jgi:hypothetical protein
LAAAPVSIPAGAAVIDGLARARFLPFCPFTPARPRSWLVVLAFKVKVKVKDMARAARGPSCNVV